MEFVELVFAILKQLNGISFTGSSSYWFGYFFGINKKKKTGRRQKQEDKEKQAKLTFSSSLAQTHTHKAEIQ